MDLLATPNKFPAPSSKILYPQMQEVTEADNGKTSTRRKYVESNIAQNVKYHYHYYARSNTRILNGEKRYCVVNLIFMNSSSERLLGLKVFQKPF